MDRTYRTESEINHVYILNERHTNGDYNESRTMDVVGVTLTEDETITWVNKEKDNGFIIREYEVKPVVNYFNI